MPTWANGARSLYTRAHVVAARVLAETGNLEQPLIKRPSSLSSIRSFSCSRAVRQPNSTLQAVVQASARDQFLVFESLTHNPYHNLAIETFLLRHSHPTSRIAFFYTNTPSVVFGRNQNPWLECNITAIQKGFPWRAADWNGSRVEKEGETVALDLIRRRSGGGTVVHDEGNLNFSFIGPNDKTFTRIEGAEIVVRALQSAGIAKSFDHHKVYKNVKVNDRHDIVMQKRNSEDLGWYKVSGSAYKLIKGRALHHGTLLHSSPNLTKKPGEVHSLFGRVLESPARGYLDAKGVGSVSSPVASLFQIDDAEQRLHLRKAIVAEIQREWQHAYSVDGLEPKYVGDEDCTRHTNEYIFNDADELMTDEWRYLQTPAFTFTSAKLGQDVHITFEVNRGVILKAGLDRTSTATQRVDRMAQLEGKALHLIDNWQEVVETSMSATSPQGVAVHLESVFPQIKLHHGHVGAATISEPDATHDSGTVVKRTKIGGRETETEPKGQNIIIEQ